MDIEWDLPLSPDGIEVLLADGTPVRVRPIRASDGPALELAFKRMSPRSRYLRFFSIREELGDAMVKDFTDIDHDKHRAWVVADPSVPSEVAGTDGLGIAVARLFRDPDDPTIAEGTVAVVDDYQRKGVGKMLLALLTSTAAANGITRLRFETLWENRGLRAMMGSLDATVDKERSEGEVLAYEVPIDPDDVTLGSLYEILRWIADDRPTDDRPTDDRPTDDRPTDQPS